MNFTVRKILEKARGIVAHHTISWSDLHNWRGFGDPKDVLLQRALDVGCQGMAREIVNYLRQNCEIETIDDFEGYRMQVRCYALTRDQLTQLLEEAYNAGVTDYRRPVLEVCPKCDVAPVSPG